MAYLRLRHDKGKCRATGRLRLKEGGLSCIRLDPAPRGIAQVYSSELEAARISKVTGASIFL